MLAPRPKTAFYDPSLEVKFKVVLYLTLVVFLNLDTNIPYFSVKLVFLNIDSSNDPNKQKYSVPNIS